MFFLILFSSFQDHSGVTLRQPVWSLSHRLSPWPGPVVLDPVMAPAARPPPVGLPALTALVNMMETGQGVLPQVKKRWPATCRRKVVTPHRTVVLERPGRPWGGNRILVRWEVCVPFLFLYLLKAVLRSAHAFFGDINTGHSVPVRQTFKRSRVEDTKSVQNHAALQGPKLFLHDLR